MDISIDTVKVITVKFTIPGKVKDHKWQVSTEHIMSVDGRDFVKLVPHGTGSYNLKKLVYYNNDKFPQQEISNSAGSLTNTSGWQNIVDKRNAAPLPNVPTSTSCLFDRPIKKVKLSRTEMNEQRANSDKHIVPITINVDERDFEINVLHAVHPCDSLWIECDIQSIGLVLQHLRNMGPKEVPEGERLPPGIRRHPKGFLCVFKSDGVVKHKLVADVQAALVWQAEQQSANLFDDPPERPYWDCE